MNPSETANYSQPVTYPYPIYYSQGFPLQGGNPGYISSDVIPLMKQDENNIVNCNNSSCSVKPTYKDVREELSTKLDNKSRKEKRKLIKNKRKRMKRQFAQQQEDNEIIEDNEEEEKQQQEELKKQERLWRERNQMMEEDNYSKQIQSLLKERKKQEEEKEKEYLREIAKKVAERENPSKKSIQKPIEPTQTIETKQNQEYCLSYLRTGSCRFGNRCKLVHCVPKKSRGLLFHNMFQLPGEMDVEDSLSAYLEYTEEEISQHFNDFYEDLIPELLKFGELRYVLISCNLIPHLRGNVYAIWNTREEGEKALQGLQGRYYGGRELQVEYLPESVMCWKYGLCNEYLQKECSRGKDCNFLHFYKNPDGKYMIEEERRKRKRSHSS